MSIPAPPPLPGIIDSHAHVHSGDLAADLAGVLERARAAGVSAIVTIGTTLADSEVGREVAVGGVDGYGRSACYGGS